MPRPTSFATSRTRPGTPGSASRSPARPDSSGASASNRFDSQSVRQSTMTSRSAAHSARSAAVSAIGSSTSRHAGGRAARRRAMRSAISASPAVAVATTVTARPDERARRTARALLPDRAPPRMSSRIRLPLLRRVAYSGEHVEARRREPLDEFVVLVEEVVDAREQRPAGRDPVLAEEVDERITPEALRVSDVVVARTRRDELDPSLPRPRAARHADRAVLLGAERELPVEGFVLRVLDVDARADRPAVPGEAVGQRDAGDLRVLHVLRAHAERVAGNGGRDDEIADAVLVGDHARGLRAALVPHPGLEVLRRLGPPIRG